VISDQYATRSVLTEDGGTYVGVVLPSASDKLKLLQSDGKILILDQSNVEEILPNRVSSMPEGLLNPLSLDQIADLFAYMMAMPEEVELANRPK
jgi:putative heme-binding domain-containing protein